MARPRRSQATRAKLIEEGVTAFLERGYHGTGIKEVLDRVHVPKGSFYNYFESKEAFAVASIRHYAACFVDRLDAEVAGAPDPLAGLRAFFEGLMSDFQDAGFVGGCLIGNLGGELEGSDLCRTALADGFRAWRDRVADALTAAQEQRLVRTDRSALEMADVLTESWEGAVIRMKIDRSLDPLRRVVDHFLGDYFLYRD
jgi:TetR/AcrR family transcriptional repressor of nem operon